jgi:flagellar hook-associated protein 2
MNILWLASRGSDIPLAALADIEDSQTLRLDLSSYPGGIDALRVRNRNTHREVLIEAIRVVDEESRGDYRPVNAASTANDAIVDLEGIEIIRESNNIDDLLDGVTINLQRAAPDPVTLDITPDRELIKEKVIEFVGYYNQVMTELNILTSNEEEIIDEITYFDDDQIEEARAKLGTFQGDFTLNSIKNAMRRITSEAYETSVGRELALLSQIGISTNSIGGGFSTSRLRGYLEINEELLDQVLLGDMLPLRELFGSDSDGDLVIDRGIAYAMERLGTAYTQTGGIISLKTGNLDSQISSQTDRIEDFKEDLEDKEAEYRRQYGTMEGTIENLEQSIQGLQNLNNTGQNN